MSEYVTGRIDVQFILDNKEEFVDSLVDVINQEVEVEHLDFFEEDEKEVINFFINKVIDFVKARENN